MTLPANFLGWLREGARAAFLRAPRWEGLRATPGALLGLLALSLALAVAVERLAIDGDAQFYAPGLLGGWFTTVAALLACWWLAPRAGSEANERRAPSASALFLATIALALAWTAVESLLLGALMRAGVLDDRRWGGWAIWLAWWLPLLWLALADAVLLWRSGHGPRGTRAASGLWLALALLVSATSEPLRLWYPQQSRNAETSEAERFAWTPALLEAQARTLAARSNALAAQRPGVIDLYAVTYAPYADEDVFLRESKMVVQVMEQRFGAGERSLMLINHRSTAAEWPWATAANLQRAIAAAAARMDADEDVLFIHLTSHGARSGELATSFRPLRIEPLTPIALKAALDAAGIKHRVISVSACYSGSWVAPLADENTLVMTAADADNTSFGCGVGSELTYYGRAVFDEALRRDTRSFETALASAREVIRQRELDAGKDDGYSNPQIAVGAAIRERLHLLAAQRAAP